MFIKYKKYKKILFACARACARACACARVLLIVICELLN